ncbi:MAG: 3-deoxy-D-manno-octulosonic acid transferase [Saprospiraceae bacterium]|nr:3-deoxy-D-manno-octulosonic acid transferase [Saprospiraceae bacterium]
MLVAYRILSFLYFKAIRLAAFFLPDAKAFVEGRKNWELGFTNFNARYPLHERPRLWVHAASLGELEQGRELIEKIRSEFPDYLLILSFFSPSGYQKRKDYDQVDYVCYFPSDIGADVNNFLDLLNPQLVIFIKYEFWFTTLSQLHKRNIPYFFIAAIFRKNHYLLRPFFRSLLRKVMQAKHVFLQDEQSKAYLLSKGYMHSTVVGDTRLDRVFRMAHEPYADELVSTFCANAPIFIGGSVWPEDVRLLKPSLKNLLERSWKLILVPHKIRKKDLEIIERTFENCTERYSQFENLETTRVLILDQVGQLARIYKYATLAYVGGGFGKGIHNILEPASFGIPVCFGPNYHKFPEAKELLERGLAFTLDYPPELIGITTQIQGRSALLKEKILTYIAENLGASDQIFIHLQADLKHWQKHT